MAARLQIFKTINLQCIYQRMWTFAVTCHAECIRLLVGRDLNVCHKVQSFCTVMQPHTVYSKHKKLLQSCYWKLKVNPKYSADLAHWTVIFVLVMQHLRGHKLYSKKNQGAYFLPWWLKNLANMRQARQGAVGLCQRVVTVKWNYCASFCVVVTVIQIVSVTEGTELLEDYYLAFHWHICCFISRSEVKFPCHITVVEV